MCEVIQKISYIPFSFRQENLENSIVIKYGNMNIISANYIVHITIYMTGCTPKERIADILDFINDLIYASLDNLYMYR